MTVSIGVEHKFNVTLDAAKLICRQVFECCCYVIFCRCDDVLNQLVHNFLRTNKGYILLDLLYYSSKALH